MNTQLTNINKPILDGQFIIESQINCGSTSRVFLANIIRQNLNPDLQRKLHPKQYQVAIKIFNHDVVSDDQILQEANKMMKMYENNIVKCYSYGLNGQICVPATGQCQNNQRYIVMELVEGHTMLDFVQELGGVSEKDGKNMIYQLVDILKQLEDNQIAHRDIKLENVIVSEEEMQVKLTDFGSAINLGRKSTEFVGTQTYIAPEINEGKPYDGHKADIWSTGVVIFSLISGVFPFTIASNECQYFKLLKEKRYDQYWFYMDKCVKRPLSPQFKDFIQRTLAYDPNERLTSDEMKRHEWMNFSTKMTARQQMNCDDNEMDNQLDFFECSTQASSIEMRMSQ